MGRWTVRTLVMLLLVFPCLTTATSGLSTDDQQSDKVTSLPGQPDVEFAQYAGYITVNKKAGRALFYWLIEATTNASTKPLVMWLNGGPGCSSLAYGFAEEIGPFFINSSGSGLDLNSYGWNREANILFLESPAGVGFSYTNTSSDLNATGDARTASDSLVFLKNWFKRFPQYKYRDFYIAGESYAVEIENFHSRQSPDLYKALDWKRHYIPQLAALVYKSWRKSTNRVINLQGVMIGNGVTDSRLDGMGLVDYWYYHSMISTQTYNVLRTTCNFKTSKYSAVCSKAIDDAFVEQGEIDAYSINTDACLTGFNAVNDSNSLRNRKQAVLRYDYVSRYYRNRQGYNPCGENYAEVYFNRPDVQKALHANTTGISYRWTACSDPLDRNWRDSPATVLPLYRELLAAGIRIWVYSGDADSVVPATGTLYAIEKLKLPIKKHWYSWYYDHQVGGRTVVYKGLTFVTIRGAGHEVPLLARGPALQMLQSFLSDTNLNSTRF